MSAAGGSDPHLAGASTAWIPVLRALPDRVRNHNVVVMAAGVAFYGLLAIVPTLVATVSIYGLVYQGNEAEIKNQIEDAAGSLDGATKTFVEDQLTSITTSGGNTVALVLGAVVALFSASGAVQKLMGAVALAYEADDDRPGWKVRGLAYVFTVGAIVGVVLMATVVGVVPAVLAAADLGTVVETAISVGRFPVFALLFAGAMTMLYRYGPDRPVRTPWRNRGAVVATVAWVVLGVAFSVYSSRVGAMPASYGLLGTVAALMIFLQLTALCVVLGAEVNAEIEHRSSPPPAAPGRRAGAVGVGAPGAAAEPVGLAAAVVALVVLFLLGGGRG